MAIFLPEDLADFVELTLNKFDKQKWVDISLDEQDFYVTSKLKKQGGMVTYEGVKSEWKVQVRTTPNARNIGLYDVDQTSVVDTMVSASVPWRFLTTNFSYDIHEEWLQTSTTKIVDELATRKHSAMNDLVELRERNFWDAPNAASAVHPYGIQYWIVKNATEGFNGGHPSGFSDVGGLDVSTYPRWKNYTSGYTTINDADLVRKWRKAAMRCGFKAPNPFPALDSAPDKYSYLTTLNVTLTLVDLLKQQNDNLGNDVAAKDGMAMFHSRPVEWIPYISEDGAGYDTSDPIYGVNWSTFQCCGRAGSKGGVKWEKPLRSPTQRNVFTVHADVEENYRCINRRKNFVLYKN